MSTIRISRLTGPRNIELTTLERPTPAAGEVLLDITAVGVCGSDVHFYRDARIGESRLTEPLIQGHEAAGRIAEVGEGVDASRVGQRVAIEPAMHCGVCPFCLKGNINLCPDVRFLGHPPVDGAYREMMTHPAELVFPLPDSINDDVGVLLEPLSIAVHIVDLLKIRLGLDIVIDGAGPVGLCCLMAARLFAPRRIVVVEPLEYRRQMATTLGADAVFSPEDPGVADEIRKMMGGYGADIVIEACGLRPCFDQMIDYARPGGKVAVVGSEPHDDFGFRHSVARRKGLSILMVRRARGTMERALDIVEGGYLKPEPMITHHCGLDGLSKTMDLVDVYADGVVKAIVNPGK